MEIGKLYMYKETPTSKPVPVIITSGDYEINGRISNFWSFKYIDKKWEVTKRKGGDYDNVEGKFVAIRGYKQKFIFK